MKSLALLTIAVTTLLTAGCASQTTVYYTLSVPHSAQSRGAVKADTLPYTVSRVAVPAAVDDTPLIVRQSSDQLMVLGNDKWTAPLGEIMRGALSQSLTQIIGMPPIQGVMQQTPSRLVNTREIVVDIQQFELEPAKQASIAAVWRVSFNDRGTRALTCYSILATAAAPGVAPLVVAQQKNVTTLAEQIAFVLQNSKAPVGINCKTIG